MVKVLVIFILRRFILVFVLDDVIVLFRFFFLKGRVVKEVVM